MPNFKVLFTETGHNNAFVIVNKIAINTVDLILSLEPLNFFPIGAGLFPGPILLSLWFGEIMKKANLDLKRRNLSLLIIICSERHETIGTTNWVISLFRRPN